MSLTDKQRDDIRKWLGEGAGIAEVQRRLSELHDVSMTYMDLRLAILEMDAEVQDKPEPKSDKPGDGGEDVDSSLGDEPTGVGGVTLTVDRVVQAGAIASGTVTFSDGVHGSWMLDQMGRLGLSGMSQAGYQPSQEDVQSFQLELQKKLTSRGL